MKLLFYKGFSFIELLISLAIMSVLIMVAVPVVDLSNQRAKEQELRRSLLEIRNAIDEYKYASDSGKIAKNIGESGYPPTLNILASGVQDKNGKTIYFLRRVPRDPMNLDKSVNASNTWKKRSYESPPDKPIEGADVFDVFSSSDQIGLNGIPYDEW